MALRSMAEGRKAGEAEVLPGAKSARAPGASSMKRMERGASQRAAGPPVEPAGPAPVSDGRAAAGSLRAPLPGTVVAGSEDGGSGLGQPASPSATPIEPEPGPKQQEPAAQPAEQPPASSVSLQLEKLQAQLDAITQTLNTLVAAMPQPSATTSPEQPGHTGKEGRSRGGSAHLAEGSKAGSPGGRRPQSAKEPGLVQPPLRL